MIILNGRLVLDTIGTEETSDMETFGSDRRSLTGLLITTQSRYVSNTREYIVSVNKAQYLALREFAATTFGFYDFIDHEGFSWLTANGADTDRIAYNTGAKLVAGTKIRGKPDNGKGFVCDDSWTIPMMFIVNARYWDNGSSGGSVFQNPTSEIPAGTVNGINAVFTLSVPPELLLLFVDGALQESGVDYTLVNSTITFAGGSIPTTGQTLAAYLF